MNRRVQRLRERMAEAGLDAMLVGAPVEDTFKTHGANRRYLSGFTGSMGWLLISGDSAFIAVDFRYYDQAQREAPDFTLFKANGSLEKWLPSLLNEAKL
ncbi:MAG TPA: aminopeptidase P family N-terminal domain-containing protein, partial [Dehalococcoidia bacterium]|nr:aminopeptidase P family N-terminal domain-containing protein [Dehalococcoidia bacterium]